MSDAPPAKRLRESEGAGGSRAPATAGAAAPANLAINYFPRDSMFTSADAQLIASDGTKLAVHSQLLINVSRVLEEAFAVGAEEGPVMLRQPFSEYSPEALCLFLRFVYRSDLLSSANELAAHSVLLPSVVRLAHALEATQQLVPLCKFVTEQADVATAGVKELVELIEVADACNLDDTKAAGLAKLHALFDQPWRLRPADVDAVKQHLGRQSLVLLLEKLLSQMQQGSYSFGIYCHRNHLCPGALSPTFSICGMQWNLLVRMSHQAGPESLSVCLSRTGSSIMPVRVRCNLTLPSHTNARYDVSRTFEHTFSAEDCRQLCPNVLLYSQLVDKSRGYLKAGSFTIRVDISLLP